MIFEKKYKKEISNVVYNLIKDYINNDPLIFNEPDYINIISSYIIELLSFQFEDISDILNLTNEDVIEEITNIINNCFSIYHRNECPVRSYKTTFIIKPPNISKITKKINYIKSKPQPEQKTTEWYETRHQLLTASSIWKAFGTESVKNQLIYDKCNTFNIEKYNKVSMDSTLHWGHKYEPLSVKLYESFYNTKVSDFGCIIHDKHRYLAASPDGINTDINSSRYGRMLEIKNIVNREITDDVKYEYWIQMQIQMEVCNLNECDFLETRFIEYEDEELFNNDGSFTYSSNLELKGIIMCFICDKKPYYEYAPLFITKEEFEEWELSIMEKHENDNNIWIKNIYWKLDELNCMLVLRNKLWFSSAISKIQDLWNIICSEKNNDFQHRAPKKRNINKVFENDIIIKKIENNENNLDNMIIDVNNNENNEITDTNINETKKINLNNQEINGEIIKKTKRKYRKNDIDNDINTKNKCFIDINTLIISNMDIETNNNELYDFEKNELQQKMEIDVIIIN
jgi:putative phage-type endonuclease